MTDRTAGTLVESARDGTGETQRQSDAVAQQNSTQRHVPHVPMGREMLCKS